GPCGLRQWLECVSEPIRVSSTVGRFLEHARIFAFTSGEETRPLIGSADLMAPNLDHRVELVAPVDDGVACRELATILDIMLADTSLAWELDSSGAWSRVEPQNGTPPRNSQAELMERAARGR